MFLVVIDKARRTAAGLVNEVVQNGKGTSTRRHRRIFLRISRLSPLNVTPANAGVQRTVQKGNECEIPPTQITPLCDQN